MSWVEFEDWLDNITFPSEPSGTETRFGTVCPVAKFRLDAFGIVVPEGRR